MLCHPNSVVKFGNPNGSFVEAVTKSSSWGINLAGQVDQANSGLHFAKEDILTL